MIKRPDTKAQRIKRHKRVCAKVSGTPERPRLNVFRSEKNIYAPVSYTHLDVYKRQAGRGQYAAFLRQIRHSCREKRLLKNFSRKK